MPLTIFQCLSCNTIIGNIEGSGSTSIPIGLDFNQVDNSNVSILSGDLIHCEDETSELNGSSYYTFTCNHCQAPLGIIFNTVPLANEEQRYCKNVLYLSPSTYKEYKLDVPILSNKSNGNSSLGEECCKEHENILEELNKLKIFCTTLFKKFNDLQKRIA
jgi:hypothetical protein